MKKILFLIFLVIGLISMAQESEVVYGTVRTDGYNYITKGALWSKRPEAKIIYEGGKVDGFVNYRLKAEHYVRFIDGEHNKFDRNYIVFPKGEMVYENTQGEIFSAKCGNKIEFIRPVTMVKIVEVEKKVEVFKTDTVIHKHVFDTIVHKHVFDSIPAMKHYQFQPPITSPKGKIRVENGQIRFWRIAIPVLAVVGGVTAGVLYSNRKNPLPVDPNPGNPAGVPTHNGDSNQNEGGDTGGPSGTPTHGDEGGPSGNPTGG